MAKKKQQKKRHKSAKRKASGKVKADELAKVKYYDRPDVDLSLAEFAKWMRLDMADEGDVLCFDKAAPLLEPRIYEAIKSGTEKAMFKAARIANQWRNTDMHRVRTDRDYLAKAMEGFVHLQILHKQAMVQMAADSGGEGFSLTEHNAKMAAAREALGSLAPKDLKLLAMELSNAGSGDFGKS